LRVEGQDGQELIKILKRITSNHWGKG
jgi:hypothetical protein